jgi:serine/threonine protein kinase
MKAFAERLINGRTISSVIRNDVHHYIALSEDYHIRIYRSGSSCLGSFDYFSIIKVVRNYTNIKVPNIISYGSFVENGISHEYVISERILGMTLREYKGDRKRIMEVIDSYREEMMNLEVDRMGRLYFIFRNPDFPYKIIEDFPCTDIGEYHKDPKIIMSSRIPKVVECLEKIRLNHNHTFFDKYSTEEVECRMKNVVDNMSTDFSFQHCDIHDDNVMISDDGNVFLVDWEIAGVYPNHFGIAREGCTNMNFCNKDKLVLLEQSLQMITPIDKCTRIQHIDDSLNVLLLFML